MDPKTKEAADQVVQEGQRELAQLAHDLLRKADAHPIGHILCEFGRAKVQKRDVSVVEMFKEIPEISSIWGSFTKKR